MSISMKQARVGIDKTMQEMADALGVHVQTYSRMEKHPEDVSIKQAIEFAKLVGIPVSDIFFGQDSN